MHACMHDMFTHQAWHLVSTICLVWPRTCRGRPCYCPEAGPSSGRGKHMHAITADQVRTVSWVCLSLNPAYDGGRGPASSTRGRLPQGPPCMP